MLDCRRCRLATRIPSANALAHRRTKGVRRDESKSRSSVYNWHNGNLLEKSNFPTILSRVVRQGVCRAAGARTHKRWLPVQWQFQTPESSCRHECFCWVNGEREGDFTEEHLEASGQRTLTKVGRQSRSA